MKLKPIEDQVLVVTGASSGIGLATARLAARRSARVVMTARSDAEMKKVVDQIRGAGGEATSISADVADREAVERVAQHAIATYGRIDTWVNNAGVSIYGRTEDISLEDMRRLFDVTFWGVVHGSLAALPKLRAQGGALINLGSVESEISLPLNGLYAAAKHAVKAFTDALRIELEKESAGISVTLVKPASIDTPFFEHAKSVMEDDPKPPPPVYAPEIVARVIVDCAERPVRHIVVGGGGRAMVGMRKTFPALADRLYEATLFEAQQREHRPDRPRDGALYEPCGPYGEERGAYRGPVMERSAYTYASMHPVASTFAAVGVAAALARVATSMARR